MLKKSARYKAIEKALNRVIATYDYDAEWCMANRVNNGRPGCPRCRAIIAAQEALKLNEEAQK
jgi:hypothetical protein